MKYFALYCLLFTLVSCFGNKNESGVLKINAPEGSTLKDEVMKNGVHFYSIKWKRGNEMTSVFMISQWPVDMSSSEMAPSVQKIAENTFAATKANGKSKIEDDAKIQYSEISEEFVSGNVAYFEHTSERGYQRILSIHMVSDGDVIWNGQFSGSKELFKEAMNIFKTMKPQSE
ncbi:MAG: hypothetical protein HOH60_04360 [Opitutae bacterium]|jgi:hypothetical protein|nr:hypothetical protein [Opitutae bacterium]